MKKSEINKLNKIQLKEEINKSLEKLSTKKLKEILCLVYEEDGSNDKKIISNRQSKATKSRIEEIKSLKSLLDSIEIIDDTGIVECHSNGGRTQTILMKHNNLFWKLVIHSESYVAQSYIRLYSSSTLDSWNSIKSGNPKRDYDIDISYRNQYAQTVFSRIINDYKSLIIKL